MPGVATEGTVADGGHNLSFGNAGCPGANADPKLGTLGNHGGPTPTIPLLAGSPAIDAIPAGDPSCTGSDQRGMPRPGGSACDIGAFELSPPKLSGVAAAATGPSAATVTGSITSNVSDATVSVHYGLTSGYGSLASGPSVPAATTPAAVTVPLTGLTPATTYHAEVVATNAEGTTTTPDLTFTTPKPTSTTPPSQRLRRGAGPTRRRGCRR